MCERPGYGENFPLPVKAPILSLVPAQYIVQQIKTGQLKTKSLQSIVIERETLYMTNSEDVVLNDVDFTGASLTDVGLDGAENTPKHYYKNILEGAYNRRENM